jgi:hypothetical protein
MIHTYGIYTGILYSKMKSVMALTDPTCYYS